MNFENIDHLRALGQKIRDRRKSLKVSAVATAEAAGISRVTLHRIEKGEPSVAMGAYLDAAVSLGLTFDILPTAELYGDQKTDKQQMIPVRIKLADYPQLKLLAWHIPQAEELSPVEALAIYERNKRYIDEEKLEEHEQRLIQALGTALSDRK